MRIEILLSIVIFLILISIGICVLLWRKGAKALKEEKEELLKKQTEEFSETMTEINKCFEKLSIISTQATTSFEELFKNINKYKEEVEGYKENKEDELAQFIFEPFYIYTTEEIETDTGEKLKENSFYLIVYEKNGMGKLFSGQGWIDLNKVIKNPDYADLPKPWTLNNEVDVKNGPSKGYYTIFQLKRGAVVEVIDFFGNWAKIKTADGSTGYFCLDDLKR